MKLKKFLIPGFAILFLAFPISGAQALLMGLILSVGLGWIQETGKMTPKLLQFSIIGLGAGMNFKTVIETGVQGIGYTLAGLIVAMILGMIFQRILKVEQNEAVLITAGTAICGGSAIAAVGPAIQASQISMSVALGTVFILNSVALMAFPVIGHALSMSQEQFGLWSALAIHDTSSVVGATIAYGEKAAEIGTTVKLSRTLWIIPITFLAARFFQKKRSDGKHGSIKKPWFIIGFLALAAIITWIPELQSTGKSLEWISRRSLVLTLFLIGLGLTREKLKKVGIRPFLFGVTLWILISAISLLFI